MTDRDPNYCRWCDYRHPVAVMVSDHERTCPLRPDVKAA